MFARKKGKQLFDYDAKEFYEPITKAATDTIEKIFGDSNLQQKQLRDLVNRMFKKKL